eukprot:jgi/Mesen1/4480/ME000228S03443
MCSMASGRGPHWGGTRVAPGPATPATHGSRRGSHVARPCWRLSAACLAVVLTLLLAQSGEARRQRPVEAAASRADELDLSDELGGDSGAGLAASSADSAAADALAAAAPKNRTPTDAAEFERIARSVMTDGSLIMVCVNDGYLNFFKNWVAYVGKLGYTDRILVFADDLSTSDYVESRWPGHAVFQVAVPELGSYGGAGSGFHHFGSKDFFEFARRRPFYIKTLLLMGISVVYSDLDTVWVGDPFVYFTGEYDFYIEDDTRWPKRPTKTAKVTPLVYTGFGADQPRLNKAIVKAFTTRGVAPPAIGLLPLPIFPPGWLFFTLHKWKAEFEGQIAVIHNNWDAGLWLVTDDDPAELSQRELHCRAGPKQDYVPQ